MSKSRTRAEVAERSNGLCELTGARAEEMSHRVSRGRSGGWSPWNVLHLSRAAHAWAHRHPVKAYAAGVFVESGADPSRVPVWLARPWPGWWLIRPATDGPHVLVPVDAAAAGLPVVPDLPAGVAA